MASFAEALNYARGCLSAGRGAEAAAVYQQLLQAAPQMPELWHEMGIAQLQAGHAEAACPCLERAVELAPTSAALLANLGAAYQKSKRPREAVGALRRAMQVGGESPQLLSNLALALKDAGDAAAALVHFDRALSLQPGYATAHFNRANLLLDEGRLDEAIAGYQRAVELNPQDAGALCKLGVAHFDRAEMPTAIAWFERALALQPNYPEALRNRGLAWLAMGDYARGWPEAEQRLACEGFVPRVTSGPRWNGEPLAGRTLLVHAEQGLGDTLQFVRYVPLLERFGGRVLLEVQPRLEPLLRQSGFAPWLIDGERRPPYDLQFPLLSLPLYVPDGSGQPFGSGPYLVADPARVAIWGERLAKLDGLRVGIAWAGSPEHPHDRFRSLAAAKLARLAAVPGIRIVSLQQDAVANAAATLLDELNITTIRSLAGDEAWDRDGAFLDTAAIVSNLDLVISVDTAIAHLAGGLGRPVWTLLQYAADWRWLVRGETTAWYRSMRLWRQQTLGDWDELIGRVARELALWSAAGG